MAKDKSGQNLWGVIIVSALICGMSFWAYTELSNDYLLIENSSRVNQSLLEHQTHVVRTYSQQMGEMKKTLQDTEQLLTQAQEENSDLKGQLSKLETVSALEERIAQLEQVNSQLKQDMESSSLAAKAREDELHSKLQEALAEQDIKSVAEGRALLAKYKQKIAQIKFKIRDFKIEARNGEIAARQAIDRDRILLGNNGFLIRNGQPSRLITSWPNDERNKNIDVDVTFVK